MTGLPQPLIHGRGALVPNRARTIERPCAFNESDTSQAHAATKLALFSLAEISREW